LKSAKDSVRYRSSTDPDLRISHVAIAFSRITAMEAAKEDFDFDEWLKMLARAAGRHKISLPEGRACSPRPSAGGAERHHPACGRVDRDQSRSAGGNFGDQKLLTS
jgi:hypothetical protein